MYLAASGGIEEQHLGLQDLGPEVGVPNRVCFYQIDRSVEQLFEIGEEREVAIGTHGRLHGLEGDEDVDVATGAGCTANDGAKNSKRAYAAPSANRLQARPQILKSSQVHAGTIAPRQMAEYQHEMPCFRRPRSLGAPNVPCVLGCVHPRAHRGRAMSESVRTHFVLPRELLEEFDRFVEPRQRSERIAELMAEWVRRERAKEVFGRLAGFMKDEDYPEFATGEDIDRWVSELRGEYEVEYVPESGQDA